MVLFFSNFRFPLLEANVTLSPADAWIRTDKTLSSALGSSRSSVSLFISSKYFIAFFFLQ